MLKTIFCNALILLILPVSLSAADNKDTPARTLAEDAAFLAEKGGSDSFKSKGWESTEVAVPSDPSDPKGKLQMWFLPDKGKSTGTVVLGVNAGSRRYMSVTRYTYEISEKDGKRFIKISEEQLTNKKGVPPKSKEFANLEYSIEGDTLKVKGPVINQLLGFQADLTKGVSLKVAEK
jgi:hypothetical protein